MLTTTPSNSAKATTLQVSVVLPAYNEATYLPIAVEKTTETLNSFTSAYEIIIAEDGSTDGTAECAEELTQKYPCVRHIHRPQRLGRGMALNNAFAQSRGEVLAYMDLDLATDLKYLKPLIEAISVEGYDFATGSRMMPQSKANRTLSRDLSSQSYNFLVRHMLGSKLKDHQCGFKAFKREPLLKLLGKVEAKHWFWDTEVMVRGYRQGLRIKEFAVEWHSGKDTKVNLAKDSWNMFWQIMGLWWNLRIKKMG
ncbi:dolichyl-phosphate beta-glucosyltransferase [Candidatus Bathycorpusculum sp.]|uniref:dolichyl-phosphate beta-glucosyltransferase n=1 Tax=Candidatus Bathycorpusculum sp. TaxID=2994959 RepID=UPI00282A459A|nr:glycosyltransferase family 2 protein [Candidatus Termitimicrobium sp.]MCL2686515.1 glycosyltransferase family 2 protein [Candidatus Termitimicrobium sp.]